jgi:adenine-specific DNA-methyltransferase
MKYMGSKRWMLRNGLGELIATALPRAARFVDLFTGSAVVSAHVATNFSVPVLAYDLQAFSAVLARAVVARESRIDGAKLWTEWYARARKRCLLHDPPSARRISRQSVTDQRNWCAEQNGALTKSYGGYYFSALQSSWMDSLCQTLPNTEPARTSAQAALVWTASKCVAAPGHTAQPFQPTRTAKPFLEDAWNRKVPDYCKKALLTICEQHAKVRGRAEVRDANEAAKAVTRGDLVFVDPPYSGVHYSRFYHVLETIARGGCGAVSGVGRYPPVHERPWSRYSVKSESMVALGELFESISLKGATVIVTFPLRQCSNGLSGRAVTTLAKTYFKVRYHWVASRFSTLGGNNDPDHRQARRSTRELILLLYPR